MQRNRHTAIQDSADFIRGTACPDLFFYIRDPAGWPGKQGINGSVFTVVVRENVESHRAAVFQHKDHRADKSTAISVAYSKRILGE